MSVTTHNNSDDLAHVGNELFDRRIRPTLRPEDDGKYVAIDISSGQHEIDDDDYAAVSRLRKRIPAADIWLVRAGHPTAYTMRAAG